jgi:hypothetical protein
MISAVLNKYNDQEHMEHTANAFQKYVARLFWGGRAVAQAVSRWLPTASAGVRARSGHVEFVVDNVALGQVFFEYFGFPCQLSFHQFLHHHNNPGLAQ